MLTTLESAASGAERRFHPESSCRSAYVYIPSPPMTTSIQMWAPLRTYTKVVCLVDFMRKN